MDNQPATFETVAPRKTNNVFHLLMTVFTLGLWAPIWLLVAVVNAFRKERSRTYRVP